jgi:formate dehydrogenase subunit gamma
MHASAFLVLLASGLVLYVPALSELVGRRPLVKDVHLWTAVAWLAALAAILALGDRRGLRRTLADLDGFDGDDRRWLRAQRSPQGRFNAGQKLNFWLTAAFTILFAVSGVLLWLGERDTRFRLDGTILLHDALTFVSLVVLCGHLYLAVLHPRTRHSLRGITRGDVRRDWAAEHYPKWVDARPARDGPAAGPSPAQVAGGRSSRTPASVRSATENAPASTAPRSGPTM